MTPLEKIDFIFLYLKEQTQYGGSWGYQNVENRVLKTPEAEISITLLKEILERLKRDNFITETPVTSGVSVYHLTFEGVLFDGYQKQKLENQKEQERIQSLAEKTVNLSERLTSLTFWIMFGTLTMAAYAIFQTVIYFFCL